MNPINRPRRDRGPSRRHRQRGIVLLVALVLLSGLLMIVGLAAVRSTRSAEVTTSQIDATRTFYLAEGTAEWASDALRTLLNNVIDPTEAQLRALTAPPLPAGVTADVFTVQKVGALTQERLSSGDYTGLDGFVQRYMVRVRLAGPRRSAEIAREIQHQFIPLFQFGVFYEKDLEIFPGPAMTFSGPIHTNANLYMGAENQINCQSTVTAVGRYWHYRKDGGHAETTGAVNIKDPYGAWQNVWRGSYWLDNRRADWAEQSRAVWGGNFRDAAANLSALRLPLPPADDQHIIIERGVAGDGALERKSKYWYKAGVRYVDGALTDSAGNALNQPGVYTYRANQFYDDRENKTMDVVDIDVAAMIAGNYYPRNGIIYVSRTATDPAVRLINAATLPPGGLTVATDMPLYIKGDFNINAKKGASLLCDALTLLSPAWADGNSALNMTTKRVASNMRINACVLTGHVGTPDGGNYSGGLENLFRFLENWDGKTLTYRGSIIDLWFSQRSTSPWSYGSFYTAPNRDWGYDIDLLSPANWPPGTPRVQTVQRGSWRQIS